MIAILSPAKSLDMTSERAMPPATEPRLPDATRQLLARAKQMSIDDIATKMHISQALAELNYDRYQNFESQAQRPAIQAFDGDVYTGLDAKSMDNDDLMFAQDHVRMLSGLYGMLRPLDLMRPYRLEMGTKRFPEDKKLSIWWENRVADLLASDVNQTGNGAILNLASDEYYASVKGRLPEGIRVVDIEFRAADGREITMHSKVARGVMARWMVHHRVTNIDDMRNFDAAGYSIDTSVGNDDSWVFRRSESESGPPAWR